MRSANSRSLWRCSNAGDDAWITRYSLPLNVPDHAATTSRIAVLPHEGQTRTVIPAKRALDRPLGGDEEVEGVFTAMTHEFTFRVNQEAFEVRGMNDIEVFDLGTRGRGCANGDSSIS